MSHQPFAINPPPPFHGLPHRPPFVFVRAVITIEPGLSAKCSTSFDRADPMFAGHFPGNALVPGVILTEALAQTAGIAAASAYPENERPLFLLSAIRSMKFQRAVRPNERILLRAEKAGEMNGLFQFNVLATLDAATVAGGQLVLSLAPAES